MCGIIERIESFGIDLDQLSGAMEGRRGPKPGARSAHSITLIVLGVVEDEWKKRVDSGRA